MRTERSRYMSPLQNISNYKNVGGGGGGDSYGTAWDLDRYKQSFDCSSQDTSPTGLSFKDDGTKMYIAGDTNNAIFQYSLSTAWDISTASYDSKSFDCSSETTSPTKVFFKDDGTKMYIAGYNDISIFQYSLSTAWDISTASYDSKSFDCSSEMYDIYDLFIRNNGSDLYVLGSYGTAYRIFKYTLSTAWDISTASYNSYNFALTSCVTGLFFKDDGTKMYILDVTNVQFRQYSLSTAWDISTASYDSLSESITPHVSDGRCLFFKNDGYKFYTSSRSTQTILEYRI